MSARYAGLRELRFVMVGVGITIVLATLGGLACSGSRRAPAAVASQAVDVRALLFRELRSRSLSAGGPFDSTRVHFSAVRSTIPGVVYWWAIYRPPRTSHVEFIAVTAEKGGVAGLVRTPAEWFRAIGGYVPATGEQALHACAELIHTTVRPRLPGAPPLIFRDSLSLDERKLPGDIREQLLQHLEPPDMVENASGWVVRFWAGQLSWVRKYECIVGREAISLSRVDSLDNVRLEQ